jgi:hypothetical protein
MVNLLLCCLIDDVDCYERPIKFLDKCSKILNYHIFYTPKVPSRGQLIKKSFRFFIRNSETVPLRIIEIKANAFVEDTERSSLGVLATLLFIILLLFRALHYLKLITTTLNLLIFNILQNITRLTI